MIIIIHLSTFSRNCDSCFSICAYFNKHFSRSWRWCWRRCTCFNIFLEIVGCVEEDARASTFFAKLWQMLNMFRVFQCFSEIVGDVEEDWCLEHFPKFSAVLAPSFRIPDSCKPGTSGQWWHRPSWLLKTRGFRQFWHRLSWQCLHRHLCQLLKHLIWRVSCCRQNVSREQQSIPRIYIHNWRNEALYSRDHNSIQERPRRSSSSSLVHGNS